MTHKEPTPAHYIAGRKPEYEPRHVIRAWGLNYHLGSAVKYISRFGRKGEPKDHIRDLEKAIDFLRFEIEVLRGDSADCASNAAHAPDLNNPKPGDKVRTPSGLVFTVIRVTDTEVHYTDGGRDSLSGYANTKTYPYTPIPYNDPEYTK